MANYLNPEHGVAVSAVKWDIGGFKLWQSAQPDVILFTPKQPGLAKGADGRYQAAVTQFRAQREGTYKIIGGSAVFTITTAIQFSASEFEQLKEQWRAEIMGSGLAQANNPRFIPLNTRKGVALVQIPAISGVAKPEHNNLNLGTPGGTMSFLVDLTPEGAQEWVQGIKEKRAIGAGVSIEYEYLQMVPTSTVHVRVNGERVFRHLSAQLKASYDGFFYGGSIDIEAEWERMVRTGAVEVEVNGLDALPAGSEEIKQNILNTFINQALQSLFSSLFQPKPDVKPAQAGNTGGLFGGTNFALKWRKESEATNLALNMRFNGWTWLKARMDADLTTHLAQLDDSYVNEVNTEMSFPATVVVDSDPMLEHVAVSWSASEGKAPEAPVFGSEGGTKSYLVTSRNPDRVVISHQSKVNFTPSRWPIIETRGRDTVAAGGNQIVLKPSSWIGRHYIYMFVREGDTIVSPFDLTDDDYLVVNVSYEGPHLPRPVKESTRITPLEPVEFSYPLDPAGRRGQAKFSAFGVIGGKLVRAASQDINFNEDAVFILASTTGIQLVSESSVIPEADELAQSLLQAKARPLVAASGTAPAQPVVEDGDQPASTTNGNGNGNMLTGTVVAVEYSVHGPALVIDTGENGKRRIRLHTAQEADPFDDQRKQVKILLDASGTYAERILVEL